ncbi:unnamed protein product [Urochloa decumbens]|uniref:FBD domain-containing protein n=1 Tax=Urochloa decumbens TaxID=240449 RepID=A0ABC9B0T8_9POAL
MPPSLEGAVIEINTGGGRPGCCDDLSEDCDEGHCDCHDKDGDKQDCLIILENLSETQHLALILTGIPMAIFSRYFVKFCPRFNKLKTLVINDYWCHPAVFSALACLLKNSPILERITIQVHSKGPKHNLEIKLSCKPMEISAAVSEHLKIVGIKCKAFDEKVHNVLNFLGKLNIWFQFSWMKGSP